MHRALKLHPASRCVAVSGIEAAAARPGPATLALRYVVTGTIGGLHLPAPAKPERTDGLWRHTCFEAFVRGPHGAYYEFNLSSSTRWAAYGFDGYRSGMRPLDGIGGPDIEVRRGEASLELRAVLELAGLPLPRKAAWPLGLSAVIEEKDGNRSYWALAHPPGQPDFHHSSGFVLEL